MVSQIAGSSVGRTAAGRADWVVIAIAVALILGCLPFLSRQAGDGISSQFCESHFSVDAQNSDKPVQLVARSGALCPLQIGEPRGLHLQLSERPRDGILLINDPFSLIYRSEENFHGDDSFKIQIEEKQRMRTLKVAVTVR
jgi:hypothetical protein